MDRVVGHGQVADPDPDPVMLPHYQRVDAGKGAAVPGPQVEVGHLIDPGRGGARFDVVGVQQEHEISVDPHQRRVFRMGNPETHHAHRHLHHFIGMRVVHEGAGAARHELIDEGFARRDSGLGQAGDAIHAIRQTLAVPVHGGMFRQFIRHENPHPVAFHHLDRRPRALAVVSPKVGFHAGSDFAHYRFRHQMEFLDAILHAPR